MYTQSRNVIRYHQDSPKISLFIRTCSDTNYRELKLNQLISFDPKCNLLPKWDLQKYKNMPKYVKNRIYYF